MTILVKVAKVPGAAVEINLNIGSTVADAVAAAGINQINYTRLILNGKPTTNNAVLTDNARLIVMKEINCQDRYSTIPRPPTHRGDA